jgi:hypothetical protein
LVEGGRAGKKFRRNTEEGERLEEGLFLVSRSIEE